MSLRHMQRRIQLDAVAGALSTRSGIALVTALALSLSALAFGHFLSAAAETAVRHNAERVAIAWAHFFGSNFDDVEARLVAGGDFTPELAIFERTREFADVFRFKLFDRNGLLIMISDEKIAKADGKTLAEHNPKAAAVIREGKPYASVEVGSNKPNRPAIYAEAYVPLMQNGRIVGAAEVYLDETRDAAAIRANYVAFGIKTGCMVLFVLAFPLAALLLVRRTLQAQNVELLEARDAAQMGEQAKSEFLATMSHELRTPMNAVIGFANLLAQSQLNGLQQEFVETIRSSSETLLALLNDVLDFSKIDAGKIELEETELSPEELVDSTLDMFGPSAYAKSLELSNYIDPAMSARIVGDPGRLRQILYNLVGNAIKFTHRGAVSIELRRDGAKRFEILVVDTGIGIEPERIDQIFNRFTQADSSTSRRYGGSGLGLAISRRLAQLMGGDISVESKPAHGSTFRVRLPLRETTPPAAALVDQLAGDIAGRRVLVVDDNAANRRVSTLMLEAYGVHAQAAEDAHQAMSMLLAASRAGNGFHVVFVDHMMPDVDGHQLAAMIRAEPTLANLWLVLSSSAHLSSGEQESGAHFDGSCPKPVRQSALLEAIKCSLRRTAEAATPVQLGAPTTPAACPPSVARQESSAVTRVLLAEDNPANCCTGPGFLDSGLYYAARFRFASRRAARASFGLR
jgi:signal transduction histidine kinase/DNA-binding response OmpR family regulator